MECFPAGAVVAEVGETGVGGEGLEHEGGADALRAQGLGSTGCGDGLLSGKSHFFTPLEGLIVLEQIEVNTVQCGLFCVPKPGNQGQTRGKEGVPGIVPICYLN
jgi:hypothetical protein